MKLELLHDADLHRNRLLRAGAQLLSTAPSDPVLGEFLFASSGASAGPTHWQVYDGVSGQGSPSILWSILAGTNRNEPLRGVWSFHPPGRNPPGNADGERAPFTLGSNCLFDATGIKRNWVQNLNADLLDGRHTLEYVGTSAPSTGSIPVYGGRGQLAVGDPVNAQAAVNRKTWQAGLTGLIVLAPVRVASTARYAGTRSGNVITGPTGALVIDGVSLIVGDRVLLKDQQTGGTAVDNGVFSVTNAGAVGVASVLTRSTDADATGELTVGSMVFVQEGTANRATQRTCQKAPGVSGTVIAINTDEQYWQLSFQQSAYTAGRGLTLNGLEFNFCQSSDWTTGSIFYGNAPTTVAPLAPPAATRLSPHHNTGTVAPEWSAITVADISDWPTPVLPSGTKTARRHTRWASDGKLENSYAEDIDLSGGTTFAVSGAGNTLGAANTGLGSDTSPWGWLWTNLLRLKPSTDTGASQPSVLLGFSPGDANGNQKAVYTWRPQQTKDFLPLPTG